MDSFTSIGCKKGEGVRAGDENQEVLDILSPGELTCTDVENVVDEIIGSSEVWPKPRRFSMHDMVQVGEANKVLLRASPVWKVVLPHVERIDELERRGASSKATPANFVARTFRQRPEVVYAVRQARLCGMPRVVYVDSDAYTCNSVVLSLNSRHQIPMHAVQVPDRVERQSIPGDGGTGDTRGVVCMSTSLPAPAYAE